LKKKNNIKKFLITHYKEEKIGSLHTSLARKLWSVYQGERTDDALVQCLEKRT
jgi:hypothetical protein